jgi:adenylate kinase
LKRVILLGPPGAGKGTQASRLSGALGVNLVSSGDLFRDHLARQTKLGLRARSYMSAGELVPDEVTIAMVMEWVNSPDQEAGFVLDGFPRSLGQAEALDREMEGRGGISGVLYIRVPRDELVKRLGGRFICRKCQVPFHEVFSPPARPGECDDCDGELYQREDDRPEAVANRLDVYRTHTVPLVEHYRRKGVLIEIDGEGTIDEVWRAMEAAVASQDRMVRA